MGWLHAHAEGAGLVSVSTTQNTAIWAADGEGDLLAIDRASARFQRLRRNIGIAAKLHLLGLLGRRYQVVMVTLTYRPGAVWEACHVAQYLDRVRKWHKKRSAANPRYVWVAEVQDGSRTDDGIGRGVIHYHCIFFLPKGLTMPKADKQGWWPHGMTNTLRARSPVGYVMSYAKKLTSCRGIPKDARLYGVGGLAKDHRDIRAWINFPSFIQSRASVTDKYRRQPGGGWVEVATGEWLPSEFGLVFTGKGRTYVMRLRRHPRPVSDVVGPYSWAPGACLQH
ncbi:MAG: hypothetical protein HY854_22475 [Burkholderiales bacterium]|nr:hypothetical protein [Burkholderiales bacterium]